LASREAPAKVAYPVTPAKAGVQNSLKILDPDRASLARNDDFFFLSGVLQEAPLFGISRHSLFKIISPKQPLNRFLGPVAKNFFHELKFPAFSVIILWAILFLLGVFFWNQGKISSPSRCL